MKYMKMYGCIIRYKKEHKQAWKWMKKGLNYKYNGKETYVIPEGQPIGTSSPSSFGKVMHTCSQVLRTYLIFSANLSSS
jgi:hypothetical protein